MSPITWVVVVIVGIILLFFIAKFIKSCLPKIVIGLVILGVLAYLAYQYLIK
jgi:hypothetical protein